MEDIITTDAEDTITMEDADAMRAMIADATVKAMAKDIATERMDADAMKAVTTADAMVRVMAKDIATEDMDIAITGNKHQYQKTVLSHVASPCIHISSPSRAI